MNRNYELGLLCLTHLLIGADGIVDDNEIDAWKIIQEREKISDEVFHEFRMLTANKKEREVYQFGIDLINRCTSAEKLHVFVMLYKLSEVDGRVHAKEIRLLLYSIKTAGIEFDDVVNKAKTSLSLI
ncbi:MAG: TerB family tellurite resistance protein [Bacteroidota bacterium]